MRSNRKILFEFCPAFALLVARYWVPTVVRGTGRGSSAYKLVLLIFGQHENDQAGFC